MNVSSITNSIISTLGNPDSRVPLVIKDVINSTGITYFSYDAGGKLEGKDRFIDEFGTEIIWIAGLPFYKTIADKTIYKLRKLSPDVDVRVVNSNEHLKFANDIIENSGFKEEKDVLKNIKEAKKRLPEFKGLFYSKFALATILTFASYYALTKYKQKVTETAITKDFINKQANEQYFIKKCQECQSFKDFNNIAFSGKKDNNQPSFKGGLESFMFNPIKNMMIVDAGITSERLAKSRNKYEFMEYAIKEGSLLFLLYVAGKWIKDGLEGFSEKFLKTPIDLDLRFLNSDFFKKNVSKDSIKEEIAEFKELKTTEKILDFIFKKRNSETSAIVNGAKLSGIISTFDKTNNIDPSKYIDVKELDAFVDSLHGFIAAKDKSGVNAVDFLKKARNNKVVSVVANLAICCISLGYVVPKLMFAYRKQNAGSKEFHVEKEIKEKLAQSFSSNTI